VEPLDLALGLRMAGMTVLPAIKREDTKYTGVHLIRPLLVVRNNVVAKAPWLRINVINPARPFTF
jgi:hypothetical protein